MRLFLLGFEACEITYTGQFRQPVIERASLSSQRGSRSILAHVTFFMFQKLVVEFLQGPVAAWHPKYVL